MNWREVAGAVTGPDKEGLGMETPARKRLLILDGDAEAAGFVERIAWEFGARAVRANALSEILDRARKGEFGLAFVDIGRAGTETQFSVIRELSQSCPEIPVIGAGSLGGMGLVLKAFDAGATDILSKPYQSQDVRDAMRRFLKVTNPSPPVRSELLIDESIIPDSLIGETPEMVRVYKLIARAANVDSTVLITGETGTGKEMAARAIHAAGPRHALPFLAVDCTSLPEHLFESELFGHEKGSFTGAHATRRGILEAAGAGTCLLDEVGELPLAMQAKLLRATQEKVIRRVGGNEPIPMRARIIAATNRDLADMVRRERFRADLYYRINVIPINLPALRNRSQDIPKLARRFAREFCRRNGRAIPVISDEAMESLMRYHWPGNVRQLENTIERTLALSPSVVLYSDDFPAEIQDPAPEPEKAPESPSRLLSPTLGTSLKNLTFQHVLETLDRTGGNKAYAAKLLGIDRRTLYRMLDRSHRNHPPPS